MMHRAPIEPNRRGFLKTTAAMVPYFAWTTPTFANHSPNDRPKIALIGSGGIAKWDGPDHARLADFIAVCDVDSKHAEWGKAHEKIGKGKAEIYSDYRRVLDRNDIDAVSISTTDHWHVKIAIEALESGKHVFCQKPLTLTLEENQLIRRACEKHSDKTFMVGTQQRAWKDFFLRAVNMVQKGLLGKIKKVIVGIDGSRVGGPFPEVQVPGELDWDMWLGPAPIVPYRKERTHKNFRWWYEYSGGKFTDWGAHHIDIALMALDRDKPGKGPVEIDGTDALHPVSFKDGIPQRDDSYNTSHDFAVKCRFADGLEMVVNSRSDNGIRFEGTKGRIFVNRKKIAGLPIEQHWDKGRFDQADLIRFHNGKPHEGHKTNFYRCIREGGLPMSDVFSHVQTMNVCHLCAIAARLGTTVKWNPIAEQIIDDPLAQSFYARERRKEYDILTI
ncbi:MAG: Gfo/Idh/MocA family oxidoreductase [Planctomycetota bacterium]